MKRPNILFFCTDSHRFDFLGCAGGVARTPNLDALAEHGVRFEHCITNSPVCAPTRCALATGLAPHRFGGLDNRVQLSPGHRTYYQHLVQHGYHVGCVGKLDLGKPSRGPGLDGASPRTYAWGFTKPCEVEGDIALARSATPFGPYGAWLQERGLYQTARKDARQRLEKGHVHDISDHPLDEEACVDGFIGARSVEWLQAYDSPNPWHLFVSFVGPHFPYHPPNRYAERWRHESMPPRVVAMDGKPTWVQEKFDDHDSDFIINARRQYCAKLELIDDCVGRICEAVKRRGEWEDTWIVFSADHGDMLGDHGLMTAGCPYEPSIHVPLIVSGPGCRDGSISEALVEYMDIGATICDLAGTAPMAGIDARSFAPILRGEADEHRNEALSQFCGFALVRTATHKYIRSDLDAEELYDLRSDPTESRNLCGASTSPHLPAHPDCGNPAVHELLTDLKSRLNQRWVGTHSWDAFGATQFDEPEN